ncbi:hypothetical protein SORBI_3010G109100 [Sorghum bicolor]|uniref:Uncharacterized protein n=1 Tax=Sorghum bicolor TaxID=4558 RepID=A0A194YJG1_SORBI|nr:hypothetical protein SORBI_3010G109100 [Sorghum bicolor]
MTIRRGKMSASGSRYLQLQPHTFFCLCLCHFHIEQKLTSRITIYNKELRWHCKNTLKLFILSSLLTFCFRELYPFQEYPSLLLTYFDEVSVLGFGLGFNFVAPYFKQDLGVKLRAPLIVRANISSIALS